MDNELEEFEVVYQDWRGIGKDGKKYFSGRTIHLNDDDRKSYIKNFRQNMAKSARDDILTLRNHTVFISQNIFGPYDGLYLSKLYKKYNWLLIVRHWADGYNPVKGTLFYPYKKSWIIKITREAYIFLKNFNKGFWCYNIGYLEEKRRSFRTVCQEFLHVLIPL